MSLTKVERHSCLDSFRIGRWDSEIISLSYNRACTVDRPHAWIDYLDICQSLQGLTLNQWLDVAKRHNNFQSFSPKLFLKLHHLMLTPGTIGALSETSRFDYCKTLMTFRRYPYTGLVLDIMTSGYLGCVLPHYPGLLLAIDNIPSYYSRNSMLNRVHKQKAQLLLTKTTPFSELVGQPGTPFVGENCNNSPRRIAVVGNSPLITQALQGDEIDSADIVIRFNNSAISQRNRKHCGSRTDLWVMSPSTQAHHCPPDTKAVLVSGLQALSRPSLYWQGLLDIEKPLSEFPASVWHELALQFQAPPSAGALLLASLEALGQSVDIRCYGFTSNHQDIHVTANHHADPEPRSNRHNWQAETNWLADRFS